MIIEIIIAFLAGILIGTLTGICIYNSRRKIKNQGFTDNIPYEIYKEL